MAKKTTPVRSATSTTPVKKVAPKKATPKKATPRKGAKGATTAKAPDKPAVKKREASIRAKVFALLAKAPRTGKEVSEALTGKPGSVPAILKDALVSTPRYFTSAKEEGKRGVVYSLTPSGVKAAKLPPAEIDALPIPRSVGVRNPGLVKK